jgi:hypothetical protein
MTIGDIVKERDKATGRVRAYYKVIGPGISYRYELKLLEILDGTNSSYIMETIGYEDTSLERVSKLERYLYEV